MTLDAVVEKIKIVFTRENYIAPLHFHPKPSNNKLEDDDDNDTAASLWRFEIISLDLLSDAAGRVKKARTARRKIRHHSKAIASLIKLLDDALKAVSDPKGNKAVAEFKTKIDAAEEKVLKYEREVEKLRVAEDIKRQKEEKKKQEKHEREKAKQEKLKEKEAKLKEKELVEAQKKEEKQKKKEEATKLRDEKKREKEATEAAERKKTKAAEAAKLEKQKARLMTFFGGAKTKKAAAENTGGGGGGNNSATRFDSSDFWSKIDSGDLPEKLFSTLSESAKASRKRRTKRVPVSVYVTVYPENAFNAQPYAEPRTVEVLNKKKFLRFLEDTRPAYFGTWSKTSSVVTGRNPLGKDTSFLDYDVDSEAEWEEGDDEVGEDLNDEAADGEEENVCEEGETHKYNYDDGWLAEDHDIVFENEEVDNETVMLRKQMKRPAVGDGVVESDLCIICAGPGGVPLRDAIAKDKSLDPANLIEGAFAPAEAMKLSYMTTEAEIISSDDVVMGYFPPSLVEEGFVGDPSQLDGKTASAAKPKPTQPEMTKEHLKMFAEFVHHGKYSTKDGLVEDFRTKHPAATPSRAHATRKLDAIALKKKDPAAGGVIWEVREEVLRELGCEKQLAMKIVEKPAPVETKKKTPKKKKKSPKKAPPAAGKKKEKAAAPAKKESKTPAKAKKPQAESSSNNKKRKAAAPVATGVKKSAALLAKFFTKKQKTDA